MAENSKEQIKADAELIKLKEKLLQLDRDRERYAEMDSKYAQRRLKSIEKEKEETEKLIKEERKRLIDAKTLEKERIAGTRSFAKLNKDVQQTLIGQNRQNSIYLSISDDIAKSKALQVNLSEDEKLAEIERETYITQINASLLQQAQATAKTVSGAGELNEYEQKRLEIKENSLGLSDEQQEKLLAAIDLEEKLNHKQQRYNQLQQGSTDILNKLPAGLQSVIGGIKGMITGIRAFGVQAAIATAGITLVVGAIVAGIDYFMALEKQAQEFREETGVTNSMMGEINEKASGIAKQFGTYGVSIEDAFDTIKALRSEMGEVANYSEAAVASLTIMKTNFNISAETAAQVQGIFENVGGLSQDTAAGLQLQVAQMSKLAGVAPKKVFADIAKNAEAASTFFKGDLTALTRNAVQAARMGSSLEDQVKLAEKLLDFESNIEKELTAATFVGGQFNLSRARALAMEGKLAEAQEETLKQIQRSGDFRKQDYFTQQALAEASNMTVEEINKQLNIQDKLSKLSDEELEKAQAAIDAGLDITNLNDEQLMQEVEKAAAQKEMASTISDMENTFKGILATVGGALMPIFKVLGPILKVSFFPLKVAAKLLEVIIDGIVWVIKKIPGLGNLVEGVGSIFTKIDTGLNSFSFEDAITPAADIYSPANGRTQISTREGGLFELSPNDDLIAAPGLTSALANGNQTTGGSVNLSALSAPMQAMVNEVKALRADLSAGKIAVYMDGQKVTNGVARAVDQTTRNSFNLGTV